VDSDQLAAGKGYHSPDPYFAFPIRLRETREEAGSARCFGRSASCRSGPGHSMSPRSALGQMPSADVAVSDGSENHMG
jgi:hypothetical protein